MARLDIRLDEDVKLQAEKATALLGLKSLTEYVVRLMKQDAAQVIAQHEHMQLKDDVFERFMTACEQAKEPNIALKEAFSFTAKSRVK